MILQNEKKFYLIGTNASDVGDCTLEAIEKVKIANNYLMPIAPEEI